MRDGALLFMIPRMYVLQLFGYHHQIYYSRLAQHPASSHVLHESLTTAARLRSDTARSCALLLLTDGAG